MRTALVTGAASGIGRAAAELLLHDAWRVVTVDLVPGSPAGCATLLGDAADPEVLLDALGRCGGRLDGLVCAAGVLPTAGWDDPAAWQETIRVDLTGPFQAARLAMPALTKAGGSIVMIGSIVGTAEGSTRSPAYAAAKSGLAGLVRSLALIGGPLGVRVNLVEPGAIDTPFDPPRFPAAARPDVPLGRMGTANEVASLVQFLLDGRASYVTGAMVRVDGGRTVR